MTLSLEDHVARHPCCERIDYLPGMNDFKPRPMPLAFQKEVLPWRE